MNQDSSSEDDDEQQQQDWNVVPGECQPTRLSTAASIHDDTITGDTVKLVSNDNRPPSPSPSFVHRQSLPGADNGSSGNGDESSSKMYPPLPQFVFGQQSGVSNAGFTSIMDELNRRLPTAEIKPEVQAQAGLSKSPKSAADLGLKSATNLKIKRKFDDAHDNEFKKMDSIADHYAAKPKLSPKKATQAESGAEKKANARPSAAEPSQPNKRIKVTVPSNEEKERRDDIKRRLEVSRQRRRSSMAANARGRPSVRASVGSRPPTRVPTASKAAGLIKSVGKKIFGGGSTNGSTTNARASTSAGGSVGSAGQKRVVKKLKKVEQPPPRTSSLTKPTPFPFASARTKTISVSNSVSSSTEPTAQAVEAQQRAAERVKMARLKESNKVNKGTPTRRGVKGVNVNKRPSQAEQVSKARMSQSPVKRRGGV